MLYINKLSLMHHFTGLQIPAINRTAGSCYRNQSPRENLCALILPVPRAADIRLDGSYPLVKLHDGSRARERTNRFNRSGLYTDMCSAIDTLRFGPAFLYARITSDLRWKLWAQTNTDERYVECEVLRIRD